MKKSKISIYCGLFAVLLFCCTFFPSCAEENKPVETDIFKNRMEDTSLIEIEESEITPPVENSIMDINYIKEHQYLPDNDGSETYIVFKSENDIEEYIALIKAKLGDKWIFYSAAPVVSEALEGYGAEFFINNNLVMVIKPEGSGGNKIEVESVIVKNGELFVKIIRTARGMTADMAYWYIMIPVEKEFFNGDIVNVEVPSGF